MSGNPEISDVYDKGITEPISYAEPTELDKKQTEELEKFINSTTAFADQKAMGARISVLKKLNAMVKEFVRIVSEEKNLPEEEIEQVGGKLCTFGSFRLGVSGAKADIDTLMVVPRHVDREHFNNTFLQMLQDRPETSSCNLIPDAFVPILTTTFDNIELDILFARVADSRVPESIDLRNDRILKNLDLKCVRSLNGVRNTEEILYLIPNTTHFRPTLRAIKLWAKNRGIYNNMMGYLGGVQCAMLVVRICQLYPNASSNILMHRFFWVMSTWKWPVPVTLKNVYDEGHGHKIWDPKKNFQDRNDLLPIITPAYPQQNSTYNVTHSSKQVICKEIKRGFEITQKIYETMATKSDWGRLFEKIDFFNEYRHFIVIIISANNEENFQFWKGHVESKIRKLIKFFDQNDFVDEAHINLHCNPTSTVINEENGTEWQSKKWIIGMKFRKQEGVRRKVNLTPDIRLFKENVMDPGSCPRYDPEIHQLDCKYCRHNQISEHLSEEDAKNVKVTNKKISLDVVNKAENVPQQNTKETSPKPAEKSPETKPESKAVKEEPKSNSRYHPYKISGVSPSTPPNSQPKPGKLIGGEKPLKNSPHISPIKSPQSSAEEKPPSANLSQSRIPTVVSSNYSQQISRLGGFHPKIGESPQMKVVPPQPQQNNFQNFNNNGYYPPMGYNNQVHDYLRYVAPPNPYNLHLQHLNYLQQYNQQQNMQRFGADSLHGNGRNASSSGGNHNNSGGGRYQPYDNSRRHRGGDGSNRHRR